MEKQIVNPQVENEFAYVDAIISAHTNSAIAKVNAEALQTYWEVGQFVSERLRSSEWGDHVVGELADYLQRRNENEIVQMASAQFKFVPLPDILYLTNFSNHLEILNRCHSMEEYIFYILYAAHEHLKVEELRRSIGRSCRSGV